MNTALDSFLRRLHRRWIVWRLLEHAGMGLIAGCALALMLGSILFYRGESVIALTGIALSLGAVIGLAIGAIRRPSLHDAAVEADRQLKLADLLGTALAVRRGRTSRTDSVDDEWSLTLLALAEARCAQVSPSATLSSGNRESIARCATALPASTSSK